MPSSLSLLVAPLLLLSTASGLPQVQDIELGPGEDVAVACECPEVTVVTVVTTTVWMTEPTSILSPTSSSGSTTLTSTPLPSTTPCSSSITETSSVPIDPTPSSPPGNGNGTGSPPPSGYRNALYFTNWGIYGANFQPQQLPADKITHVLYAFADIASDGEVKSSDSYADLEKHYPGDSWNDVGLNAYGCVKQLYKLKKQHRQMKTLLSIGGWTYSPKFAPVAATEAGRQRFCNSSVTLLKDWGFDGLDIDWEYPSDAQQAQDFVALLRTCRDALDAYAAQHAPGYHFILTIAAPAGPQNYNTLAMEAMDPLLDAWHVMAYDYAGSWDTTSGHQANLYPDPTNPQATKFSTDRAVRDYLARGTPPHKILLGLPLYGRAFEGTKGLAQSYTGVGQGSIQNGIWLYKDLPRPGATELYDDVAKASYSFNAAAGQLVSYDTVGSAAVKAGYLVEHGLGGAVFWEAAGDKNGSESLVGTLAAGMGQLEAAANLLSYPASRYENIRKGVPGE